MNRFSEYEAQAREWVKLYAQEGMITEKETMVLYFSICYVD